MDEIIRQNNPEQLKAVELISAGRGVEAMELLASEQKVHEISERDKRAKRIARSFVSRRPENRANTIIVTGRNLERQAITKELRAALKKDKSLGESVEISVLRSLNLTKEKASLARNYKIGGYLRFHDVPRSSYLKAATLYQVKWIDGESLVISDGKADYRINPTKFKGSIEALFTERLDVAVGDRIKFTANDRKNGWYNGTQMDVTEVGNGFIKAKGKDAEYTISTTKPIG
jgi:hypothetical protein